MPISFSQAALGAVVEVPTLTGTAELKIPAGTQYGQMFRLRGLGLPDIRSGRKGDEIVQVHIEVPKRLDKSQEKLLRDYAKTEDRSVLPESKGFLERLRDYLAGQTNSS
jgi:molecular chaperone DnaJ